MHGKTGTHTWNVCHKTLWEKTISKIYTWSKLVEKTLENSLWGCWQKWTASGYGPLQASVNTGFNIRICVPTTQSPVLINASFEALKCTVISNYQSAAMKKAGRMLLPSVGLESSTNDVILLNDAQNFSIFRWRSTYTSTPGMIVTPTGFEHGSPIACSLTMGQLKVIQLLNKLLIFMEPEGSLQYSQQLASGLYPNPDKTNVHPQTLSPYAHFYLMFPSISRSPT